MKRFSTLILTIIFSLSVLGSASPAFAKTCPDGKSATGAMWLSVLHAGLGEWHLNGYGSFRENVPQKKFWLGFIPIYGFPFLSIVSAIDAHNCRTDDDLWFDD